jgi:hypothetical protein
LSIRRHKGIADVWRKTDWRKVDELLTEFNARGEPERERGEYAEGTDLERVGIPVLDPINRRHVRKVVG